MTAFYSRTKTRTACAACLAVVLFGALSSAQELATNDLKQAQGIVDAARVKGKVGGTFDFRVKSTDRSYNYKLRATWLTPEVVAAAARLIQAREGMTADQVTEMIREAERPGETVVLLEIDPREGSGVIPRDWTVFFGPKGEPPSSGRTVKGVNMPALRDTRVLSGARPRDYSYDQFWIAFPIRGTDGKPLITNADRAAEVTVRIYNKVGKVSWPISEKTREYITRR